MIKHVVMLKLNDPASENLDRIVNELKALKEKIEVLQFLEVGLDFKRSPRSYDIILNTHFADKHALETYRLHPDHQPVLETIRALCSSTVVVDYETE